MARIYLARHGSTRWNLEKVFRGRADVPLDDLGRQQALSLAKAVMDKPRRVFSSPLVRAMETASIAAGNLGLSGPEALDGLIDMSFGDLQGLPEERVWSEYPGLIEAWKSCPEGVVFPSGEGLRDVAERACECLLTVARRHRGETLLLVSHRVVNKVLILNALGAGLGSFWRIKQDAACVNVLDLVDDYFVVRRVNDTCHLQGLETDGADF